MNHSWRSLLARVLAVFLFPVLSGAETVPLKRVVELALSHATAGAIAAADEQRAAAAYRELRNNYIPQLYTGAGLGYSFGFPLALEGSAPSLFNINTQSALLNPSLRDFVKAAKVDASVLDTATRHQRLELVDRREALARRDGDVDLAGDARHRIGTFGANRILEEHRMSVLNAACEDYRFGRCQSPMQLDQEIDAIADDVAHAMHVIDRVPHLGKFHQMLRLRKSDRETSSQTDVRCNC